MLLQVGVLYVSDHISRRLFFLFKLISAHSGVLGNRSDTGGQSKNANNGEQAENRILWAVRLIAIEHIKPCGMCLSSFRTSSYSE